MDMLNVAIVGIENTHAEEIIKYLNVTPPDHVNLRVSALVAGDAELTSRLTQLGGIETVVEDPRDLMNRVDALIVTSRDGALHRDLAVPFLQEGKPVWVDKPLAASVADAEEIIATATRSSAALTSSSALRWVPSTDEYARRLADIGELHAITVTGPADEFDPHSGLIFYGIHIADVAQRLLPGSPEVVDVEHLGGMIVAQYRLGNVRVSLEFVQPDDDGQVPFRVTAVGRHGVISGEIEIDEHYVEPGVDAFATMLATGSQPISMDEMLAPVRILEQVRQSIGR